MVFYTLYVQRHYFVFGIIIIISVIFRRFRYFPLTSLRVKSFLLFWMTVTQKGEKKRFERVANNSMEVCPALPHKRGNEGASSLPSRSEGKTLRTSFLEEKPALKGQRRKVGNVIFFFLLTWTNKQIYVNARVHTLSVFDFHLTGPSGQYMFWFKSILSYFELCMLFIWEVI